MGGVRDLPVTVSELEAKYPEADMFGVLPAYALYCRHAKDVTIRNFGATLEAPDVRPAVLMDDVKGLDFNAVNAASPDSRQPLVRFDNVRDAFVHGCRVTNNVTKFLFAAGSATRNVHLFGNELSLAGLAVVVAPEVPKDEVKW